LLQWQLQLQGWPGGQPLLSIATDRWFKNPARRIALLF
jgi:hypothetical protein